MPYEVQTPVFEGPFDLLLHLILQERVDIYEVSLTHVVHAYLAEVERMAGVDLETASEFLLIAATLVELKSRRLLPSSSDAELDEELAGWEERDLLLGRLLECKTFKDAARAMERRAARASLSYPRTAGLEERFFGVAPDLLAGVTPQGLRAAFLRAVAPKPVPKVDLDHVAPVRASVRDAVVELLQELPWLHKTTFRRLTADTDERLELIVRFLAVLELFKQGLIELAQAVNFGEIEIEWLGENQAIDVRDGDAGEGASEHHGQIIDLRLLREAEAYDQ